MITIQYQGYIYNIEQEPFETLEDSYKRGWYIIKNFDKYKNYNELYSRSIMMLHSLRGATYLDWQ